MSGRTAWQAAFLDGDAPCAVRAVCEAWTTLVLTSPDTVNPGKRENHLTEILGEYLRGAKAQWHLTGDWSYEHRQGRLRRATATGMTVTHRKRTDIRYFSNARLPALELIFEFKFLDHSSGKRRTYVKEGLRRFLDGDYSQGQPVALMAAMLTVHRDDALPPLRRWLAGPKAHHQLDMACERGRQVRDPSALFPAHAAFDTEHLRDPDKAPAHGTIVVSHLFLEFPNPPRAEGKRARRNALHDALEL
ncbi:MAG: hypothetical protein KF823_09690 [Xanthomonadales bacterium]|nr:hypothetical protein [Xanthomonadales bacterium]